MIKKYDANEVEKDILNYWHEHQIYEKIVEKNKGKTPFYFLQGPPYTSGRIHIGHAWNNSMKDLLLRFKRMKGFDVWDRAGYDMHGLPTENKVQKNLNLERKEDIERYGIDKFIKECISLSQENALQMDKDLLRLGIWMDYKNAYWPIRQEFIENEWWFIKQAHLKNRLYKGKKVMTWCKSCETALAKHELEYETVTDDSIFLKFKIADKKNEYLVIWTTTPWTIPFNLAIMVNPELDYVKAQVGNENWIIAKGLVGPFMGSVVNKKFEILEEFKGEKIEGLKYIHPMTDEIPAFREITADKLHTVLMSTEYVSLDAGTGLVHCAPGCGPEDFEVGQKNKLPSFNNLSESGVFENMGIYDGKIAKKDDKYFTEELDKKGALIETTKVEHEYAHCWRCHNPVVFRATEQWFLKIEDLREQMIEGNKNVYWVPESGKKQFDSWVMNLRDNSITRQRYWGCPAPIWECECGNKTIFGSKKELEKAATTDVPDDLHRPWIDEVKIKCSCGREASRIPDVIDVWIDSGTLSFNCLDYPARKEMFGKLYPADFILEATEQVRLWFSMLAICSHVALGSHPYKNVHMHGMILDYQGMKMSKSMGNIISPYEVVDKYGADILRYYMCEVKAGENINFNWEEVKIKQRNLSILWNLHNFLLDISKEIGINPVNLGLNDVKISIEERYILSKLNSTIKKVSMLYDSYRLDETITMIEGFFLELSRTYVQITRDKASMGLKEERQTVLYVIYSSMVETLKMFSTIAPFISERIYLNLKEAFHLEKDSIALYDWPAFDEKWVDREIETNMKSASEVIQTVLFLREKIKLGIRWPLREVVIVTKDAKTATAVEKMRNIIKTQTNIKNISVQQTMPGITNIVKADFSQIGPDFGSMAPKIVAKLITESTDAILSKIEKEGKFAMKVDGKEIHIVKEHLIVTRAVPMPFEEGTFSSGFVYVDKELDDALEAEGFAREIMRRVQALRKKAGMEKKDRIILFIKVDDELNEMLKSWEKQIAEKVGAEKIKISASEDPAKKHANNAKEKIKDKEIEVWFDKI